MNRIISERLKRKRAQAAADAGISIVEVIAAVMIFMILSVGLAQGLVTSIRLAGDQKHRITALSLAASDIDLVRGMTSAFDIDSDDYAVEVDGTTYEINRSAEWVDANGNDVSCGTGSGTALRVLRVNVDVTWAGQMRPISPVNFDTVVAPNGSLHDEDMAVLLISVRGAAGTGLSGIAVGLTATSTLPAGTVIPTPTSTNSEGCSYAVGVAPGSYDVSVAGSGYITSDQVPAPAKKAITVEAGDTKSLSFTFDRAGTFPLAFVAPNGTSFSGAKFPTVSEFTLLNSRGSSTAPRASSLSLFPWDEGYSIMFGKYTAQSIDGAADPVLDAKDGCQSPSPSAWGATDADGTLLGAGVTPTAVALPGQAAALTYIGAGLVEVQFASGYATNRTVTATTTDPDGYGDPGCGKGLSYSFTNINSGDLLALPFGTWTLSSVTSSVNRVSAAIPRSNVASYMTPGPTIVTLDPRPAG